MALGVKQWLRIDLFKLCQSGFATQALEHAKLLHLLGFGPAFSTLP